MLEKNGTSPISMRKFQLILEMPSANMRYSVKHPQFWFIILLILKRYIIIQISNHVC